MREFFGKLIMEWWGIAIIVVISFMILLIVSAIFYCLFFKRFYDIVLSAIALILLLPVLLVLTILGVIIMKGNPFFTQFRPGRNEKIFKLIKFRTMTSERGADGKLLPDEKRLTKYGKFLRRSSLDELPELINIFLGDMSIVGPRPQLVRDMVFMSVEQRKRHNVRPGLTGLAQVSGRNGISWEKKLQYDLRYIEKISLWGDIKILFMTVFKVLERSGIEREGTVSDIDFGDWLLQNGTVLETEYIQKQEEAVRILAGRKQ